MNGKLSVEHDIIVAATKTINEDLTVLTERNNNYITKLNDLKVEIAQHTSNLEALHRQQGTKKS